MKLNLRFNLDVNPIMHNFYDDVPHTKDAMNVLKKFMLKTN